MFHSIELDKMRNFRYGMKAISLLEKKFKKPVSKINFGDFSMEDYATFLWAGLAHEDKGLTVDKIMDLVDEHSTIKEVMQIAQTAFVEAMGAEETPGDTTEGNEKND